jgi:UDP-N-acetylglucosamine 2-epimerase (non-hydrolysing)
LLMKMPRIAIVLGTRPEIIKMSPIIRACERQQVEYFILHTGQHYSYNLDRFFFEQLGLPEATYNLDVGSGTHGEQTGKILSGVEQVLVNERPDVGLVEGDTKVLAGALAAAKRHISPSWACGKPLQGFRGGGVEPHVGLRPIKVGHVEAGLRSYDRQMPEVKEIIPRDTNT